MVLASFSCAEGPATNQADLGYDTPLEGDALKFAGSVFNDKCVMCHEEGGDSEDERLNLVDDVWIHGASLEEIAKTIRDGVPDTDMKGMVDIYGEKHVVDLAKYVLLLDELPKKAAPKSASGEAPLVEPEIAVDVKLPSLSKLESIRIHPDSPTLWGPSASQRFTVVGTYADGIDRDITSICDFTVPSTTVANIDSAGRLRALSDGEVVVTAEAADYSVEAKVSIEGTGETRPFSFQRDITGILTERGCNASDCHGGVKGRGGFKLSLNALYPEDDYDWILNGGGFQVLTDEVKGERIPRVNVEDPEQSLVLLKATYSVSHEGGKRFAKDSQAYQTIRDWVEKGAPYDDEDAGQVNIERLELFPSEVVMDTEGVQQIVVTAHLRNGKREDVTDQVFFKSNNKDVAKVTTNGVVVATGVGETNVVVRAAGAMASARFGVIAKTIPDYPEVPEYNFIDKHIAAKLRKLHITPSPVCSDEEFIRRICLDLTGILPPVSRLREFLADTNPNKREELIDTLMRTPEFVDFWIFRFSDVFRVRLGGGTNHGELYWSWIRNCITTNKPYDQIARERLSAQGWGGPGRSFMWASKPRPTPALLAEDVQVFHGRRLDCAQCHNHPYETWSQNQFWGIAAFYGRLTTTEWVNDQVLYDEPDGHEYDWGELGHEALEFEKVLHPRTKELVTPTFFDGTPLPESQWGDPRVALAEWITTHPYFPEAAVNRMWSYFFGRGFVNAVDDFTSTNLPSHPELLAELAENFKENGYDLRHLIRLIVTSRAYQLSSIPTESNKHDSTNYSHALPRPLDAEVLLDAIMEVTGIPVVFDRSLGNVSGIVVGRMPPGTRVVQMRDPVTWPSRFLDVYGRPTRQSVPERSGQPNVEQAMHMLVGDTYTDQLANEGGRLDKLMKDPKFDNRAIVENLYLAALSREPTKEEGEAVQALMNEQSDILTEGFFGQNAKRKQVLEDFVWGLLSSREFAYNH